MTFSWAKGHGTENDFVLLPDADGTVHGELDAAFVAALCDRRRGLGADGVLRVVRTSAVGAAGAGQEQAEWFMDYRNADGSISEMCGNGVRVFARYLADHGLADPGRPLAVGTRDGIKTVTFDRDLVSVDMGVPELGGVSKVTVEGRTFEADEVHTGNPHAVAQVDSLDDAGTLLVEPEYDRAVYPHGVNIELVARRGPQHVAMRVHERGSGETRSCGTGACAAAVASMSADGVALPATYRVDVPGGRLDVTWTPEGRVVLTGPAEIVAEGEMEWLRG